MVTHCKRYVNQMFRSCVVPWCGSYPCSCLCTLCATTCMSTNSAPGVAFTSTYTAQSRVSIVATVESELLLPANDLRPFS